MTRIKVEPFTCPVCNGTGSVSTPPGVAGDQPYFSSSTNCGPWPCRACQGAGVLWAPATQEVITYRPGAPQFTDREAAMKTEADWEDQPWDIDDVPRR